MHSSALILSINKPIDGKINNTCALCITLEINKQCWKIPTDRMRKSERERGGGGKVNARTINQTNSIEIEIRRQPAGKKGKIHLCVRECV